MVQPVTCAWPICFEPLHALFPGCCCATFTAHRLLSACTQSAVCLSMTRLVKELDRWGLAMHVWPPAASLYKMCIELLLTY